MILLNTRTSVRAGIALVTVAGLTLAGCGPAEGDDAGPDTASRTQTAADASTGPVDDAQSDGPADEEATTIDLGLIGGAPSVSAAHLVEADAQGSSTNDYEVLMVNSPDEIVTKLVNGELDAATVPPNLAATLYNRTEGGVQLAAVTTLGFIQIVSSDESIQSLEDLRGTTVESAGKGAVPEYTLTHVLQENGLVPGEDLTVNYYPGHDEVTTLFATGQTDIAALPAPSLVNVMKERDDFHVVSDLTEEWTELYPDSLYAQGSLVLSTAFVEEHPEAARSFVEEYAASAAQVEEDVEKTAELTGQHDIMPTAVALQAIPDSHQVFITGEELRSGLPPFLEMLFEADPKSVGGEVPGEDFFYQEQ